MLHSFYLRKSHTSKKWIVFLEGGWYCYDNHSCRNRWLRLRHLMTSSQWPETRDGESTHPYHCYPFVSERIHSTNTYFNHSNYYYSLHFQLVVSYRRILTRILSGGTPTTYLSLTAPATPGADPGCQEKGCSASWEHKLSNK